MSLERRKILFVVNDAGFFKSHRLRLAQEALCRGYEPVVVCGAATGEDALGDFGIRCRSFDLSRSGLNPLRDLNTVFVLVRIYRQEAPDIVHHVTIKPVIYGTLASRFARVPAVVNAIPGMGFVFTQRGFSARVIRSLVNLLYRIALSHDNMRFIFQNREDLQSFVSHTVIPEQLTYLIRGSGVDLDEFPFLPEPDAPVSFVLVARMLSDKGVREFVDAARGVRRLRPDWRFVLVGGIDPGNPSSLTEAELEVVERRRRRRMAGTPHRRARSPRSIACGVPAFVSRRAAEIAARSIGDRPRDDCVERTWVSRSRA